MLLGATGTGKSATTAWLVERLQRPDPGDGAEQDPGRPAGQRVPRAAAATTRSSTSSRYYDYYQPEAYVPQTDTYIEKDSSINDEVERLRHSATNSCSPGAT